MNFLEAFAIATEEKEKGFQFGIEDRIRFIEFIHGLMVGDINANS